MARIPRIMTNSQASAQKLTRFFTGKQCARGHVAERLTSDGHCIKCARENEKERRKSKDYNAREIIKKKTYRDDLRKSLLTAYGNKCACPGCDVVEDQFLCLDHKNGGGRKHRKVVGSGIALYILLRNQNFPKDEYRLLCHNCNHCYGHYGTCPHVVKRGG